MSTDLAAYTPEQVRLALLEGVELPALEDSVDVQREIIARILAADSDEAVYAASDATGGRELLDVALEVLGVSWRPSTFEGEGPKVYVVMDVVRMDTGERLTVTSGAGSVVASLLNFDLRGSWPQYLKLRQTKPNAEGRAAIRPMAIPAPGKT